MIRGVGQPVQLDFEDVPANAEGQLVVMAVAERYKDRGIVFADFVRAVRLPPDHAGAPLPSSGAVLLTNMCASSERTASRPCASGIGMSFTGRMGSVEASVGTAQGLENPTDVQLSVLDAAGDMVGFDRVTLPATGAPVSASVGRLSVSSAADIRAAEITWADGKQGQLVVDDVSFTPSLPEALLSATPGSLHMDIGDRPGRQVVEVTNNGDAATSSVTAVFERFATDTSDAPVAAVDLSGGDCLGDLGPAEACSLTIGVKPVATGLLEGEIVIRPTVAKVLAPGGAAARMASPVLLRIPLQVRVQMSPLGSATPVVPPPATTPPPSTPPSSPSPTDTKSATPSPTPTYTNPGGDDPLPWYQPLLDLVGLKNDKTWLLPAFLALVLGGALLARGLRGRHGRRDPLAGLGSSPRVLVRPDRGSARIREIDNRRVGLTVRSPAPSVALKEVRP